ncbi:OmpA family protein [candidate division WOR-3 bacterium]|nr:OmpA family protein [candidate division WOR-3 bacterium]
MRSWFSFSGWLLFLLAAAGALVFYNVRVLPLERQVADQRRETRMWTQEVQGLHDSLARLQQPDETMFFKVLTDEELFSRPGGLDLSEAGRQALQDCIVELQSLTGVIEVTGHTDNTPVPAGLVERLPTNWEYGAAKAAAVVQALAGWGIPARRLMLRSAGDSRPRDDNSSPAGRARNRRVELLVMP